MSRIQSGTLSRPAFPPKKNGWPGTELASNSDFPAEANPIPFPEVARNSAAFENPRFTHSLLE